MAPTDLPGDYGLGEFPGIPDEGRDAAAASLTPLRWWAPQGSIGFETSAVCHLAYYDYYIIFAAFATSTGTYQLWALKVDGLSTYYRYGELVGTALVAEEPYIEHVDCAEDGSHNVFVTWDRQGRFDAPPHSHGARWARLNTSLTRWGPYPVPPCASRHSFGTGIAYHGGRVVISSASRACLHCWFTYDAMGGALLGGYEEGPSAEVSPYRTDVEWNGNGFFVMTTLMKEDRVDGPMVTSRRIDPTGDPDGPVNFVWNMHLTPSGYRDIDLVYSATPGNWYGRGAVQIDEVAVWLNSSGLPVSPVRTVGPWDAFALCEYWGPTGGLIAHTYYPDPYGFGSTHVHWSIWPPNFHDAYEIDRYRWPSACSSSNTFSDPELLVAREYWGSPPASYYVFWTLEQED